MFGSRNTVYHIFNRMNVSVYVCVYEYVCVNVWVCVYMSMCVSVCMTVWECMWCMNVWVCEYVCMWVCVWLCVRVHVWVCVYMSVYVCVCTTTPKPQRCVSKANTDSTSPVLHFWNEEMSKPLPSNSEFKSEREICGRDWEGGSLRDEGERRKANIPLVTSLSDVLAIFSKYGFTLVNTTDSQNSAHPNPPSPHFWLDARACPCRWWEKCHLS